MFNLLVEMSVESGLKKRKYEKLHCQHCHQDVSKSTWYLHYEKYFDSVSGKWKNEETSLQQRRPDFNFEQESSEESDEATREYEGDFSFPEDQDQTISNVRD